MAKKISESILQKRIKRFKSMKRGYYSLIILGVFYIISLLGPLWMNNKPLVIKYENKYYFPAIMDFLDFLPGVNYPLYEAKDFNQNINSIQADFRLLNNEIKKSNNSKYVKPIEKNTEVNYKGPQNIDYRGPQNVNYTGYNFNLKTNTEWVNKYSKNQNTNKNFIIMPLYPYHPHEDLKDELDELYTDVNNDGNYNLGEPFIDENNNGVWNENYPPTLPDGFNGRHLLGTDNTGRDVFTRLVDGYKISITFAIIVTTLGYIIGIIIGALLGFYGGKLDLFGVRIMEVFTGIPFLFVMMILASFMKPNIILLATLSVLLKGWIGITYFIRGEFYREKAKDYVSAAVSLGASNWQVMFKHILPNALTPIITFAPFSIIADIGTLVSLDFLGYGLRPPTSSWGNLLSQAAENLYNWHMLVFPVIILTITIFMITFISEAIREAFDPRVYSRLR